MWTAETRRTVTPASFFKVTSDVSSFPPVLLSPTKRRKWVSVSSVLACVDAGGSARTGAAGASKVRPSSRRQCHDDEDIGTSGAASYLGKRVVRAYGSGEVL